MADVKVDWFDLAKQQLRREGRQLTSAGIMLRGLEIIRWVERHPKAASAILSGKKVFRRGNGRLQIGSGK